MKEPTLVIMAAGMGSRYGGLKQIDPVGRHGEIIIDYSIFDAMEAGFQKIVFIINEGIDKDFREVVGDRVSRHAEVKYVHQQVGSLLPAWFTPDPARVKPWGTAHAILCCKDAIDGPFGAINADDYYGKTAYKLLYDRLCRADDAQNGGKYDFCMVGYLCDNTLTDNGSVARGICTVDGQGRLCDIDEQLRVVRTPSGCGYLKAGTDELVPLSRDHLVSMNCFGFTPAIFGELEKQFPVFLKETVPNNPLKGEFYIPVETGRLLREGKATVDVMATPDKWFGVTYHDDKPALMAALADMTDKGLYPDSKLLA